MKKSILIFLSCAAMIACNKEEQNQNPANGLYGNAVSISEVTIPPIGNELESERTAFTITSNTTWKIEDKPNWLIVSPMTGKPGTTAVTLYAGIYDGDTPSRECTLKIVSSDNSFTEEISVFQERPYLEINREGIDFEWNQCDDFDTNKEIITIRTNTDWKIEPVKPVKANTNSFLSISPTAANEFSVEWLVCSELQGSPEIEEHPLYFNPQTYNIDNETRKLELKLSGALEEYILTFTQKNLLFTVELVDAEDNTQYEFAACNNNDVTMIVESECDWRVESKPTWLVLDNETGKTKTTVKINTDGANPDNADRTGNLVLEAQSGTNPLPHRVVEVTQKGYVFNVQPASIAIQNNDLEKKTAMISSSGKWDVDQSTIPDWLESPVLSGSGNEDGEQLSFRAKSQNLELEARQANVKYRSAQTGNTMSQIVNVKQDEFVFDVQAAELNIGTFQTSTYNLTIHSSGEWKIDVSYADSPEDDWLNIEKTEGTGDAVIKYNAKSGNILDNDRKATLTIRSITHENAGIQTLSKTINLKQSKYTFSVDPTPEELTLEYKAVDTKSYSIVITSTADWTITNPSWIVPSQTSGKNNATVTFKANSNPNLSPREDKITIKVTYQSTERSYIFTVKQEAFEFDSAGVEFLDLEALNAGQHEVSITCSGDWEIRNNASWIKPSLKSGSGNATITISADDNVETQSRESNFEVYSKLNSLTKSIRVTQKAFVFDTAKETVPQFAAVNPVAANVTLGESMADWTVEGKPEWLTVTPMSGSGSAQFTLTPTENVNTTARNATIKIVSKKNQSLFKEISVSQAAFVFDTTKATVPQFAAVNPAAANVTLGESMADWTVEGKPEWLTVTPMSGSGSTQFTITPTDNVNTSVRNATLKIVSKKNQSLFKEISISQAAFVFDTAKETVNKFAAIEPKAATVVLGESMSTWKVQDAPTWLKVTPMSGSGSTSLTLTAEENTVKTERSAVFKIVSDKNSSLVKEISVSQAAFVFDTTKATVQQFAAVSPVAANVTLGESMSEWTVEDKPDWLTVTPMSGSGSAQLTLTPTENVNTTARNATLKIVSKKNTSLFKEVAVSQAAFVFDTTKATVNKFTAVDPQAAKVTLGESMSTWKVQDAPEWLTVTPMSGSGSTQLTLTPTENIKTAERSAVFKIVSDKNSSLVKEISVSQAAFEFDTTPVTVNKFATLSASAETVTIGQCSGGWTVKGVPDWLTVQPQSGTGAGQIRITPSDNLTKDERSVILTVESVKNPEFTKKISVSQSAFVFDTAKVTVPQFTAVSPVAANVTLGESMADWTVEGKPEWLTVTPMSGSGSAQLTLTPTDNVNTTARNATLKIVSKKNTSFFKEISVSQAAYNLSATPTAISVNAAGGDKSFNVQCSGKWGVVCTEGWIHLKSASGTNDASVEFTVDKNENTVQRSATITLSSKDGYSGTVNITVTQSAAVN